MINNLSSEKIVMEVRDLVSNIESFKEEVNVYCDLMKQMFLSGSSQN